MPLPSEAMPPKRRIIYEDEDNLDAPDHSKRPRAEETLGNVLPVKYWPLI